MKSFSIIILQIEKFKFFKKQFFVNILLAFIGVYIEISILEIFTGFDNSIITYMFVSTTCIATLATNTIPDFCKSIKKGEIVRYFTKPLCFFHIVFMEELGNSLLRLFAMFPLMITALFISKASLLCMMFFVISILLSMVLATLVTITVFSLALYFSNFAATKALLTCISSFFSGAMIPLVMLPAWFSNFAYFTPFALLIDGPAKILLQVSNGLDIIILQLLWIFFFYFLALVLFHYTEASVNVYGG